MTWVTVLLVYSYIASVLPVWMLLQPRDYINSLQLLTALGLIVAGLFFAAFMGGAPPVEGAARQPLEIVEPAFDFEPSEAPLIFPYHHRLWRDLWVPLFGEFGDEQQAVGEGAGRAVRGVWVHADRRVFGDDCDSGLCGGVGVGQKSSVIQYRDTTKRRSA